MRKTPLAFVLATFVGIGGPAAAQVSCGDMLMPVVQLKQVSRGLSRYHSGLDLMAPYGSPVRAAAAGTVVFAGRYFGYGNMIDLRHADGTVTRYAHLSAFTPGIRPGAQVAMGAQIGAIGTSGHAHGAHLHFEVRMDGRAIDPKPFIALAVCTRGGPARELIEEARAPATVPASAAPAPVIEARPGGLLE
ncbi:M23 family metallopeptidase [Limobrevibacterium gyesilva]|uniref:M23 family metallopeptidase n=1 Tax=Limobrevibacterium gyesilva TaxID=2991712 RepID=A0AA41YL29_9PROT|nr:M23 family metallopeptidase [Limobrevibacterium gyesilva]MCW3474600.1 M23 family metallopeptidase [Limobrevibacterium gyesilva]